VTLPPSRQRHRPTATIPTLHSSTPLSGPPRQPTLLHTPPPLQRQTDNRGLTGGTGPGRHWPWSMRGSRNSSPETRRGGGRPLPQMPNTVAVQRRKYVLTQSEKCEGWENGGRGRRRPGGGLGGGDGPAVLEGQEAADLRGPLPVGHPLHRELEERRGRGRRAGIHRGVKGRGGCGAGAPVS